VRNEVVVATNVFVSPTRAWDGWHLDPEGSRLTGIAPARLRRWLRGYYRSGNAVARAEPVWRRQVPDIDEAIRLGSLDLKEARFVDAFRSGPGDAGGQPYLSASV
jgi:hypothetical protein